MKENTFLIYWEYQGYPDGKSLISTAKQLQGIPELIIQLRECEKIKAVNVHIFTVRPSSDCIATKETIEARKSL